MKKLLLKLAAVILRPVIDAATPWLRDQILQFLTGLYRKAKETENPIDELLVEFLLRLFDLPMPERLRLRSV